MSDRIKQVNFRLFVPRPDAPDMQYSSVMFQLPKDYTDGGNPNIYYFLPPDKQLDAKSVDAMLEHETLHGALDHNEKRVLTPEQYASYQEACTVLRKHALDDMSYLAGSSLDALYQLREMAPKVIKPAYTKVISAIENGTYGDLPTRELEVSEVPECYIQPPTHAVYQQAIRLGVDKQLNVMLEGDTVTDLTNTAMDDWNNTIEDQTVYKYLKEATWLPYSEEGSDHGHPQDGMREVTVSSLNRLMKDPETFGRDIATEDDDVRKSIITLLDLGVQQLQQRYPDAHDLRQVISERRAVFNKQLPS